VSKPRLLIPMSIQFSVRYIVRTGMLNQLSDFVQPIILLDWRDEDLEQELREAGAEVHFLIPSRMGERYQSMRTWINVLHKKKLNTSSEAIFQRRADLSRSVYGRLRRRARRQGLLILSSVMGGEQALLDKERHLLETDTNAQEVRRQIDELQPDAAFSITPYLDNEHMALRACNARNIPICTSILSFDNITTRGWMPVDFDSYLLWNRYNSNELFRAYPHVKSAQVRLVGAPQFDFYWKPHFLLDESEWRRQLSLPPSVPVILYGGGHHFCARHEPSILKQLDEAIERNEIPRETVILFRSHPVDAIERWSPVIESSKHILCDHPSRGRETGKRNMPISEIQRLASTLLYAKVHVNVASTMAIDGAIFDRPQVGPAYDDTAGGKYDRTARELYLQEHYVPITNSGGVDIAHSRDELVRAVRSALDDPTRLAEGRRRIVKELCTFSDGGATERVVGGVRDFIEQRIPAARAVVGSN